MRSRREAGEEGGVNACEVERRIEIERSTMLKLTGQQKGDERWAPPLGVGDRAPACSRDGYYLSAWISLGVLCVSLFSSVCLCPASLLPDNARPPVPPLPRGTSAPPSGVPRRGSVAS